MASVGFVGLGVMGGGIAARLNGAGHDVVGYNRTREKARWLEERGIRLLDTPRAVAEASDVVFSMVTNTQALAAVAEGPDGIIGGLRPGQVYVDMTTCSPEASRELAAKVARTGAGMLDAPVSGSVATLEQGKLAIMVGGDEEAFRKIEPILLDIGPTVRRVGENGQAVLMKIAINLSLQVQIVAFSEGLLLAVKSGIDPRGRARDDAQVGDREPDAQLPGAVHPRSAGRGVVRRQHDAEGHEPCARGGPAARRLHADDRRGERDLDRRTRDGSR